MKRYNLLFEDGYEDKDDYDKEQSNGDVWLQSYTLNPYNKYPTEEEVQDLLHDYPCNEKDVTYLRGINFKSIEDFKIFKNKIIDKKTYIVDKNSICSFTLDKVTALKFATTKPMYLDQVDKSDLKDLTQRRDLRAKEAERYDGYKGIVIGVKADNKKVIDVNKSKFAKENEYLLTYGKYKIVYLKLISKFKDIIDKGLDINKFVRKLTLKSLSGIKRGLLEYIIKHNLKISKESKHILFEKLLNEINDKLVNHKIQENYNYDEDKTLIIYYDRNIYTLIQFDFLWIKTDYNKLILTVEKICKNIYDYLKQNNLFQYPLYDSSTFEILEKYESPYISKIKKQFNLQIAKTYSKLNSKEEIDRINSLPSGKQQRQAIDKLINDMVKNFKNIV